MRRRRSVLLGTAVAILISAVASPPALAAARFARSSGSWNSINWSGTSCSSGGGVSVPGSADDVTICDGVTVTVNSPTAVASISMPAGNSNTILQVTTAQSLSVSGNVTMVAGKNKGDHRQLLLSNGAALIVGGSITLTGGGGGGGDGNDNRWALLQLSGASATIGGSLQIDGLTAGNDRARVTLTNTSRLTVGGTITLGAGGLLDNGSNGSVISIGGDFTHVDADDDYVSSAGEFRFTGSGAQALNGGTGVTTTFFRLTVDKPTGDVTINHTAQVANGGTLALTSGRFITGTSHIGVGTTAAGTISGGSSSSYVAGNLRRYIPTGTQSGILFPVGGSSSARFAQVQIDFPNVSTAGQFQVAAATGDTDHPDIATSAIEPARSVNRYWTLTNVGAVAYTTTGAAITFNYPSADVDADANTSAFIVGAFASGAWNYPTAGALSATSAQVTGVAATAISGDYAIGEVTGPYSHWSMNETSWNGTSNEVVDGGSGANAGSAGSLATPRPTTSNTTPAIAGSPGTCRYGVFNRTNKDYVSLPTTYPNLAAQSFTITAWIRTTDRTRTAQRIFIDDEGNSGGWGLSLGDSGTAGALRLYSRGSATQILDTGDLIADNTWYFVAASIAISGTTTVVNLYVYSAAGALAGTANATWSGFTWGNDTGRPSIGGETNASGEGTSDFGFAGNIDEVRVYRLALNQNMVNRVRQLTSPCTTVDHYALSGSATAATCDATVVQVTAHDSNHTAVSPGAGTTLTLSTSTTSGVWVTGLISGTGGWTPSGANNGSATYVWPGSETSFSVRLRHNTVATVNINLSDDGARSESATEDLAIGFVDSAFRVTDKSGKVAVNVGTQLSGKNSNVGFGAQSLYLQAIRTDTATGSCVGLIQGQTVTIEMAAARVNPTGGSSKVSVQDSSDTMVAVGTGAGSAGSYTGVSLTFDANSMAPLVLNYPDAGSITLHVQYPLPTPPETTYVSGNSNAFVVRPFGLRISGPPSGRTGASSAVYAKAGATWDDSVTVAAVAWESADDALDNDGMPDSDALLANNTVTASFGAESPAATVTLSHTLVEPAGGVSGALTTSLSAFTNGQATTSASFSEVGIIDLFASSANYLGTSQTVRNSTAGYAGVGRFYPDHFFVSTVPTITNRSASSCAPASAFTYMGEDFVLDSFTLQARNTAGAVTQNYGTVNGFAKLNPTSATQMGLAALSGSTDLSARLTSTTAGSFVSGAAPITGTLTLKRSTAGPDGPYSSLKIGIAPNDGDGDTPVTLRTSDLDMDVTAPTGADHKLLASTDIRFGRLRIQNAIGSAQLDLPITLRTEYFNGTGFVTNLADGCTTLQRSDIRFDFVTASPRLSACDTVIAPTGTITFSGGVAVGTLGTLRLTKPASQREGAVGLTVNLDGAGGTTCTATGTTTASATDAARPYLQSAWTGGTYAENPRGRFTFGVYKGAEEFIHFQENF